VALGVGAIVTLVSLGIGLQSTTAKQIASMDALVTVNVSAGKNSINSVNDSTVDKIKRFNHVALVSPTISTAAKVTIENSTSQAILQGVNLEAFDFEGIKLASGEKYGESEGAVISKALAKNFGYDDSLGAIGKKIKIQAVFLSSGDNLSISEFAKAKTVDIETNISGVSDDELIGSAYLSLSDLKKLANTDKYNSLKVKVDDRRNVSSVRDEIEKAGFNTSSVVDLIKQVDQVFLIAQIILGIIGGVALLVALLGIANIMTISLLERTHEVGIMKAIGATNKDIKRIFEFEVVLYGLCGGAMGVGGAWLFGKGINIFLNYLLSISKVGGEMTVFITPLFFAGEMVLLTVLVALLAGWYPTKRASRLSPMEALRYE
jgi:putative ABC transport system permease protein